MTCREIKRVKSYTRRYMKWKRRKKKKSRSFSEVWEKAQETDAANDFRRKIEMGSPRHAGLCSWRLY